MTTASPTITLPVGSRGVVVHGRGSSFVPGDLVEVLRADGYEYRARRLSDSVTQYLYPDDLRPEDINEITDLDAYKRAVVRIMWQHKKTNGWCSVAEALAKQVGLASYLPSKVQVQIVSSVTVERWPGMTDSQVTDVAYERRADAGHMSSEIHNEYPAVEDDEDVRDFPEDTLDTFRERLASVALAGAREHGVSGVPAFLTECGIDPSSVREKRKVYVTTQVEVEVGGDEDHHEAARALVEQAIPDVRITEVWGG